MVKLVYVGLIVLLTAFVGCRHQSSPAVEQQESKEAKRMLQGIWVDGESESVVFKVVGDSIFYPDSTSMPTYFKVVGDSLRMGPKDIRYSVVKQTPNLFWFENQNGDVIRLHRSENMADTLAFVVARPQILTMNEVVKRDTVVMLGKDRYHCYIAVNPTKYKVVKTSYNDDGVEVSNVYYDNIIHVSVYRGAERIYSSDFRKHMFSRTVPERFLMQAVLGSIEYVKADNSGFHFNATLCIPDDASCYLVEVLITQQGRMTMKLLEY